MDREILRIDLGEIDRKIALKGLIIFMKFFGKSKSNNNKKRR